MVKHRVEYIDGLRGVAALFVVFSHVFGYFISPAGGALSDSVKYVFDYNDLGRLGVVAFFAVSGFVIPFSFSGQKPLKKFAISRFFRLYPAYWASVLAILAISPFVNYGHFSVIQILANLTMVQDLIQQKDILGVYWTLSIEVVFYCVCAFLFWKNYLFSPVKIAIISLTFIGISISIGLIGVWTGHRPPLTGYLFFLALMFFGTITRQYFLEGNQTARSVFFVLLAALIIGNPIVNYLEVLNAHQTAIPYAKTWGFYEGLALFLVCCQWKLFRSALWQFLGRISYSLYLFHLICMYISIRVFGSAPQAFLPVFVGTLGGAVIVSNLVYAAIERPAMNFGRSLRT